MAVAAVASHPSGIKSAVGAYIESTYKPGEPLPVQMLVQFDRTRAAYEVTLEDADVTRWQVTPANNNEIAEKLKPSFD